MTNASKPAASKPAGRTTSEARRERRIRSLLLSISEKGGICTSPAIVSMAVRKSLSSTCVLLAPEYALPCGFTRSRESALDGSLGYAQFGSHLSDAQPDAVVKDEDLTELHRKVR